MLLWIVALLAICTITENAEYVWNSNTICFPFYLHTRHIQKHVENIKRLRLVLRLKQFVVFTKVFYTIRSNWIHRSLRFQLIVFFFYLKSIERHLSSHIHKKKKINVWRSIGDLFFVWNRIWRWQIWIPYNLYEMAIASEKGTHNFSYKKERQTLNGFYHV